MLLFKAEIGSSDRFYVKVNQRAYGQGKIDEPIVDLCIAIRIVPVHKTDRVGGTMVTGYKYQ